MFCGFLYVFQAQQRKLNDYWVGNIKLEKEKKTIGSYGLPVTVVKIAISLKEDIFPDVQMELQPITMRDF